MTGARLVGKLSTLDRFLPVWILAAMAADRAQRLRDPVVRQAIREAKR